MRKALVLALAIMWASAADALIWRDFTGRVVLAGNQAVSTGRLTARAKKPTDSSASAGVVLPIVQEYTILNGDLSCSGGCVIAAPGNYDFAIYVGTATRPAVEFPGSVSGDVATAITLTEIWQAEYTPVEITAETGDITSVAAGAGLAGGGATGDVTLTVAADVMREGESILPLSPGGGTAGQVLSQTGGALTWTTPAAGAGDIESVDAAGGLTGGGTTGAVTLAVGAGTGITVAADAVSATLGTSIASGELDDGAALAEILDDDGSGSLLDADFLDGTSSAGFATAGHTQTAATGGTGVDSSGWTGVPKVTAGTWASGATAADVGADATGAAAAAVSSHEGAADPHTGYRLESATIGASDLTDGAALSEIADDDGDGSGLDADTLTGQAGLARRIPVGTGTAWGTSPAPTTDDATADVILGASAATQTPFDIIGAPAQSAPLQRWKTSAGAVVASVSTTGTAFAVEDSATATSSAVQSLTHTTTGTAANYFGLDLESYLEDAAGATSLAGRISTYWTDITNKMGAIAFSPAYGGEVTTYGLPLMRIYRAIAGTRTAMVQISPTLVPSGNSPVGPYLEVLSVSTTGPTARFQGYDTNAGQRYPIVKFVGSTLSKVAGDGAGFFLDFRSRSSTTLDRQIGILDWGWIEDNDATRTGYVALSAYDSGGERQFLKGRSTGTGSEVDLNGGYAGGSGATISGAGVIQANGAILSDSTVTGSGFSVGASAGLTTVVTVRDSGGAADCTMTFSGGILTATTCSHT